MLAFHNLTQPIDFNLVVLTGASSCITCSSDDCSFGYFQSVGCSLDRDRICKPYQYSAPEGLKYFIACGQVASVGMLTLLIYKLFLEHLQLKSIYQTSKGWNMFYIFIGFWDFVSDITMLALIEPFNPYGLFWISLGSIAISFAASVLLASMSNIKMRSSATGIRASWPVRIIIFIASCGNLFENEGSSQLCFNWPPEFSNHIAILMIEQTPQLGVQCLLLHLQGIQGFSPLDWAIWCQSAAFTLLNAFKNIKQVFLSNRSPRMESLASSTDTQMEVSSLAVAGAGGLVVFGTRA